MTTAMTDTTTQDPSAEQSLMVTKRYRENVTPFWLQRVSKGMFLGQNNIEIHYAYAIPTESKGVVAISSGRIESLVKYKELVFNLYNAGYGVFIHDHRGQGLSGRMATNAHLGYVDDFDDYVADFKRFYDTVIAPKSALKPMLLCHSMGSAIGMLYVMKYPDDFARVALSAPMFGIRPVLPRWFAYTMLGIHRALNALFSRQPWYFWGQMDYSATPFESNILTHCEERYQLFREEYEAQPCIKLGGVSGKWLYAAQKAMGKIFRHAAQIKLPVLLLQAGADRIVDNQQQISVSERLPNCELHRIQDARHELLMETDGYRDQALRQILQFFDAR